MPLPVFRSPERSPEQASNPETTSSSEWVMNGEQVLAPEPPTSSPEPNSSSDDPATGCTNSARREADAKFRQDAITAYGSDIGAPEYEDYDVVTGETKTIKTLWCPVLRNYCNSPEVKARRIVPRGVTDPQWTYIFGLGCPVTEREGHGNTLVLEEMVMSAFEHHVITLLPVRDHRTINENETITGWKVKLLDESVGNAPVVKFLNENWAELSELGGKVLDFHGDARPRPAFLYYHYLMSLAKASVFGDDWNKLAAESGTLFASSGVFIRRSVLCALARYLEDDSEEAIATLDQGNSFEDEVAHWEEVEDRTVKQLVRVEAFRNFEEREEGQ